ncbi:nicotinamide-nucleotide amidohydrolase family protein [Ruania suaedae]|uniref:CinA family protein n=1 Tax=Ruania suaedae TaxID=2897774 RepID=UPI001E59987D|nr:nicotinamide-nucleotide amidohydrolase family protein [Ruania suaedae]UFU04191.1 nicotinamide-nucleotide amidohydrolase family protein [Ruania suaedae]
MSTAAVRAAGRVIDRAREAGVTLAVAESLTAGALAARLADIPGASAVLTGGVVAYATEVKAALLGVDRDLLDRGGPVHPQVAVQMADGVRGLLGAGLGLATTGVAGPGPADGRPAGTLYVAAVLAGAHPEDETLVHVRGYHLAGTRPAVQAAAVSLALAAAGAVLADRT